MEGTIKIKLHGINFYFITDIIQEYSKKNLKVQNKNHSNTNTCHGIYEFVRFHSKKVTSNLVEH